MKFRELQNLEDSALKRLSNTNREEIRELRFKFVNGQEKNIRKIRNSRKILARVLTLLHERVLKGEKNNEL